MPLGSRVWYSIAMFFCLCNFITITIALYAFVDYLDNILFFSDHVLMGSVR